MTGSDDPANPFEGIDEGNDGRADAVAALATGAVLAGVGLVVAGVPWVARLWGRVPLRPDTVLVLLAPLPVRVGVPLAAAGVAYGGTARLSPVSLSPTERQRRVLVAGALVAGVGAASWTLAVLGGPFVGDPFRPTANPLTLLLSPLVVGWSLVAAGLVVAAWPAPLRTGLWRLTTETFCRLADATAGPFPTVLRIAALTVGGLVAGYGGFLVARLVVAPPAGARAAVVGTATLVGLYVVLMGVALAAVGAVVPDGSRLPAPPPAQRVLVLAGAGVSLVLPLGLRALPRPGIGGALRLGTTLVVAGLCWWAGEALATRSSEASGARE